MILLLKVYNKSTSGYFASSEEIAFTMSEIAKGATDQAVSINEGMNCMNSLSDGINMVRGKTQNVYLVLEETKKIKDIQKASEFAQELNELVENLNGATPQFEVN